MIDVKQNAIIERFYQNFKNSMHHDIAPAIYDKQLVKFQKSLFGENSYQQNEAFNNWLYNKRPDNKRFYCVQGDQVVGQQSAISIRLDLADMHISAACAVDLRIRPEWKMKGLGVAMMALLMHQFDVIIGVGVSDEAYRMFIRQGWMDLGLTDILIKPMKLSGYNKDASNTGVKSWLKYSAALLASNLSNYYRDFIHLFIPSDFRKLKKFTNKHEDLINNTYERDVIRIKKDKEYLNWRFIDFPGSKHYDIYELIKNKSPVAFFSIKTVNNSQRNELIISEIHASKQYMGKVIDEIIRLARKKRVSKIVYSGLDSDILTVLKSRLFYKRPYGDRFLVFSKSPDIESKIKNRKNWHICNADSDAEFNLFNSGQSI